MVSTQRLLQGNCMLTRTCADILPVVFAAIECPTHSIVDAALRSLPVVLPALDFSTIKNELFPIVAGVFSKTNSLAIKVRGLQAFVILCGGSNDAAADDGLSGLMEEKKSKSSSSTALDKYTMQEKIVPLIKAIKTKEPAVMIAALNVLRIVGEAADADFVAMDILPVLWSMSLGPLLELKQFQLFMTLIKNLSRRVEDEQTRKLQELSGAANGSSAAPNEDFLAFGGVSGTAFDEPNNATADDFEALVKGKHSTGPASNGFPSWDEPQSTRNSVGAKSPASTPQTPAFSWSTQGPTSPPAGQSNFRTVTPDLARFETMTPSSTQYSQPLQPTQPSSGQQAGGSLNWSTAGAAANQPNPWASSSSLGRAPNYSSNAMGGMNNSLSGMSIGGQRPSLGTLSSLRGSSFSIPPPPGHGSSSAFGIKPPPSQSNASSAWASPGSGNTMGNNQSMSSMMAQRGGNATNSSGMNTNMNSNSASNTSGQQKSGLDKYQSLI